MSGLNLGPLMKSFALRKLTEGNFEDIVAACKNKIFVQGIIWCLNSFELPGVKKSKHLAISALRHIRGERYERCDAFTNAVISVV